MLRVGLTGGLGSGKSTAAKLFAARGAHVLQSDVLARELMLHSGEGVYDAIVARFGAQVVLANGKLDREALARIAFVEGRVEELNEIVHPAVIARQAAMAERIFAQNPHAVVVLESALIFETKHGGKSGWRNRFDCIVLVTAPQGAKIERHARRLGGETIPPAQLAKRRAEAQRILARQIPDEEKIPLVDFTINNDGSLEDLELQVDELWPILQFSAVVGHV